MEFTEVQTGQSKEMPAKTIVYGVPKIGKSNFTAQYPDPFFLDIEGGLSYLQKKVRATPKLTQYDDVIAWLKHIYEAEKPLCKTLVVDSLDWLEKLAQERLIKQHNAKSIVDTSVNAFAYYKGVLMAAEDAFKAIQWIDAIYKKHGIKAVLIAHSQIKEVDLPGKDPYRQHEMKLSKYLGGKTTEWADLILFADFSFHVTSEGKTSEPKRVLFAGNDMSFIGGGRMSLSKELPLDYKQLEKEITQ